MYHSRADYDNVPPVHHQTNYEEETAFSAENFRPIHSKELLELNWRDYEPKEKEDNYGTL